MVRVVDRLRPWLGNFLPARAAIAPNPALIDEAEIHLLEATSDDILCRVGPDLGVRSLSANAPRLFGGNPGDMAGRIQDGFIGADDVPLLAAAIARARIGTGKPVATAIRVHGPGGVSPWVRVTVRPVHNAAPGEASDTILVMHDVTPHQGLRERLATPAAAGGPSDLAAREMFGADIAALTDIGTGVANRQALEESLALEWARAARQGTELSLLLIGLDGATPPQDRSGQPRDDTALSATAAVAQATGRRADDQAAYYRGDELALLLPRTPAAGAATMAKRIRAAIVELHLSRAGTRAGAIQVTASLGVATAPSCRPDAEATPALLMQAAEAALAEARSLGASRMVAALLEAGAPERPPATFLAPIPDPA
jgi:diguanylate cyclase (GGDEF)-like protein